MDMRLRRGSIATRRRAGDSRTRGLLPLSVVLLGLVVLHTTEHLTRHPSGPGGVPPQLWPGVVLLYGLVTLAVVLSARADARAPDAAVAAGFAAFVLPLLGHALPDWGVLSLSYWGHGDLLSWGLLVSVNVLGLWLARAGLRRRKGAAS